MASEVKTLRAPEAIGQGDYESKRAETKGASGLLLAVLVVVLLAAGAWASAVAAEDDSAVRNAAGLEQSGGKYAPPDEGNFPASRPRGLPRRSGRPYGKPQVSGPGRRGSGPRRKAGVGERTRSYTGPEGGRK